MIFEITGSFIILLFMFGAIFGVFIIKVLPYLKQSISFMKMILNNKKLAVKDFKPEILLSILFGFIGGIISAIIVTLLLNIDIISKLIRLII